MKFEFYVGGFTGSSYKVNLEDNLLIVQEMDYGHGPCIRVEDVSIINNPHWEAMLAYLETRKWKPEYFKNMMDGTSWEISLETNNKILNSSGSNAYAPGYFKFLKLLNVVLEETSIDVR